MFLRLFKSKASLDHKDPELRRKALIALSDDQQEQFLRIAKNDESQENRLAALERIQSLDVLANFLDDPKLSKPSLELVSARAGPSHELSSDSRVIHFRLTQTKDATEVLAQLDKLKNPETTASLILDIVDPEVRMQVTLGIRNAAVLAEYEKLCRGIDKVLHRVIKERLSKCKSLQSEREKKITRTKDLIASAEQTSPNDPHYDVRRDALETQWQGILHEISNLEESLSEFEVSRFDIASLKNRFPKRVVVEPQRKTTDFDAILKRLRTESETIEAIEALENAWKAAADISEPSSDLANQFYSESLAAWQSLKEKKQTQEQASYISTLVEPIPVEMPNNSIDQWQIVWQREKEAKTRIRQIDDYLNRPLPNNRLIPEHYLQKLLVTRDACEEVLTLCKNLLKRCTDRVNRGIAKVDTAVDGGETKKSLARERETRTAIRMLPIGLQPRYTAKLAPVSRRVHELGDWKSFAENPKRSQLCESMEHLIVSPEPPEQQYQRIRLLRSQWMALDAPRNEAERNLQARFDKAAEQAFEVCAKFFDELKNLRRQNLEARIRLCDDLESFIKRIDWNQPDWKSITNTLNTARSAWRQYRPIDWSRSRSIRARYGRLINEIQAHLDENWAENTAAKERLIERAQLVITTESISTDQQIEEIKNLQAQWKVIGPTKRKVDQNLWETFHSACNVAFKQRATQKHERRNTLDRNTENADRLVNELSAMINDPSVTLENLNISAINRTQEKIDAMELPQRVHHKISRDLSELKTQLASVRDSLKSRRLAGDLIFVLELDNQLSKFEANGKAADEEWMTTAESYSDWFSMRRPEDTPDQDSLREIVVRAEILANLASPKEDQSLRMQIQVSQLESGLRGAKISDSIDKLVRAWCNRALGKQNLRTRLVAAVQALV